jgi:hypothetical protein
MTVNLPSDNELDAELETRSARELSAEQMLRDSTWSFKFSQPVEVDPADVHGAGRTETEQRSTPMGFVLPNDDELDAEFDQRPARELSPEQMLKDTVWDFKFTQTLDVDPADVHCS